MRDAGDVEDRILVFERVEAGVIAEGALGAEFVQIDVAFEDDLGVAPELPDRRSRTSPARLASGAEIRR